MFDVAPSYGVDFNRCTNKELFEYAKEAENDATTLQAIKSALASREREEAGFVRQWIDARLSMLERQSQVQPWYATRALRLVIVALIAIGVGIGQGAGQFIWDLLAALVTHPL